MSKEMKKTNLTRWGMLALVLGMTLGLSLWGIGGCSSNGLQSTTTEFDAQTGEDNLILSDSIIDLTFNPEEEEQTFAKTGVTRTLVVDVLPVEPTTVVTYTATATYSPDGFYMVVDFGDEETVFRFDPDAVSAASAQYLGTDSIITITGVKTSEPGEYDSYEYTCSPHGLVFDSSVQVTQPYSAPTGTMLGLYYMDETARRPVWEYQGSSAVSGGFASFDLWHFSKYGISR